MATIIHHFTFKGGSFAHCHFTADYFKRRRGQLFKRFFLLLINYFDNVMTKFIVDNRTDALKTDANLFFL